MCVRTHSVKTMCGKSDGEARRGERKRGKEGNGERTLAYAGA